MKTYINIAAVALAISVSSCLPPASSGVARSSFNQPGAPLPGVPSHASFDIFYQELAPYGTWMNNPQFGQVWIPNVDRSFQPYVTRGHWVMTEYGNTWVSHYDWGWAPFHYGRWFLDDYYGWMWVPGNEWGPAWVAWRSGGGYYGWAPLSPGLNVNVNINIGRHIPYSYWSFAPQRYITSPRIYDYCVPRGRVVNVINQTTVINNTHVYNDQHRYYSGPQRRDIERATRQPVPVRRLQTSRRPGAATVRGGSVAMYRPEVRRRGVSRSNDVNSSRSVRSTLRNDSPTRSSYDRSDRSAPAVRSSRSRDNAQRSQYDRQTTEPARSSRQNRVTTPSTATPSRSSGSSRYERRSAPERSPARTESRSSSSRSVSPGNSRSESSRSSSFSRSSDTRSSQTRSASPTSRSESSSSPSRSRSSASPGSSSSSRSSTTQSSETRSGETRSGVTRSGVTRSAPSRSRSETQTASPSSRSSTGRSRSGVTRSSRPQ